MNKKGQALVEFIIILPVLIMLFFGAIDFARIAIRKNELESITGDVVKLYKEGKTYENIESFLLENNESNSITIKNKDNKYVEFNLQSEMTFVTPGLGKILGEPYKVITKRVVYYDE